MASMGQFAPALDQPVGITEGTTRSALFSSADTRMSAIRIPCIRPRPTAGTVGGLPSNGASIDFDPEMEPIAVYFTLAFRGVAAGLIIAAPVGPVNLLCIRRTLEKGWRSGMVSGFGAALADTAYGAIAGFGISLVIQFLIREEFWIRVIGGIFLMCLGVLYYRKPLRPLDAGEPDSSANSDFISAFLLNATNPTTVLSFLAVLATLGVGRQSSLWQTLILVPGIFCGSMMWWTILACTASRLRSRITDGAMRWMNHLAGIAIGCFGLANVLLSRGMRH